MVHMVDAGVTEEASIINTDALSLILSMAREKDPT
jgi:hypothetical protein